MELSDCLVVDWDGAVDWARCFAAGVLLAGAKVSKTTGYGGVRRLEGGDGRGRAACGEGERDESVPACGGRGGGVFVLFV
jgi:hypothetical protein